VRVGWAVGLGLAVQEGWARTAVGVRAKEVGTGVVLGVKVAVAVGGITGALVACGLESPSQALKLTTTSQANTPPQ
jgi:hypothetical protein